LKFLNPKARREIISILLWNPSVKHAPWELISYVAGRTKDKAAELEKYLKSGSGHALARKHFW
jgi:hypothetical protein